MKMKKRKTLLSVAYEFLVVLPRLFRHRPMQLMFIGLAVIFVSSTIFCYYNISQWIIPVPLLIGVVILLLGVNDLPEPKEETEHIREEAVQDLKDIKKELKEIRNRLEKIEGRL